MGADVEAVIKERQTTMKQQGKDMGAVKAFLDGKGDQTAALTAATNLTSTTHRFPICFRPGPTSQALMAITPPNP